MDVVAVPVAALYGLLIGSFLNVAIHRVPAGRSVVRPRSACPECGTEISARDNIPVLSWVVLRGRCRHCGTPISIRYPAVEVFTAIAFAAVALRFGWSLELPAFAVLAAGLVAVSAVDLDCRRIPTPILTATLAAGVPFLLAAAAIRGDGWALVRMLAGGALGYGALYLIHRVQPRGMGFGDVRLAGVLGVYLGWLGAGHVPLGLFLGFAYGSMLGIALIAVGRGGRRTAIPFGPFLAAGAATAVFVGGPLIDLYLGATV